MRCIAVAKVAHRTVGGPRPQNNNSIDACTPPVLEQLFLPNLVPKVDLSPTTESYNVVTIQMRLKLVTGAQKKEDFGLDRTHLPTSNVVRFREHATCGRQLPKRGRTHAACHVSETRSFVTLIFRSVFLFVKVRFLRCRYSSPAMHGPASTNWHLSFRSSYKLNRSTRVLSPPCEVWPPPSHLLPSLI